MSEHHLRFPPDSTGKRVGHSVYVDVDFNNGTIPFIRGERISSPISLVSGTIIKVDGNTQNGSIYVLLDSESPETFSIGEAIQVGGVTKALASSAGIPIYNQIVTIAGQNNPKSGLHVDFKGAASVRFTEGEPQFDAYGRMGISAPETVAEYTLRYDDLANKFTTLLTGGGTSTFNATQHSIVLSCGTASGDKVIRRSNIWHKNQTGISQLVEMSVLVGDSGKTGVRRSWGYYDDNSGIRFELVNDILYAVWRSKTSGSLLEIRVPQTEWNFDRLDGSLGEFNLSGQTLDLTKINNFWVDLMCSAGTARCGVIIDNVRIICHKFAIGNVYSTEHLIVGTLPLTWEQENISSTSSSSEFRVYCSIVKSEGDMSSPYKTFAADNGSNVSVASDVTYVPIFSGRAKQLFKTSDNRSYALPSSLDVIALNAPIIIELVKNSTLTGATWTGDAGTESCMETDTAATISTGGTVLCSHLVNGSKDISLTNFFNNDGELISRKAVITDAPDIYTIRAKLMAAGTAASVRVAITWKEM
jgi:hypothetical protein